MKLDGFPGVLKHIKKQGNAHTYLPTPEQEAWILRQYTNYNIIADDIAETIGTSPCYVHRFCHKHGLYRDIGKVRIKSRQLQQVYEDKKNEIINATAFIPDKDLLNAVNDTPRPIIGPCIGEKCVNYNTISCYLADKRKHRTECNAIF